MTSHSFYTPNHMAQISRNLPALRHLGKCNRIAAVAANIHAVSIRSKLLTIIYTMIAKQLNMVALHLKSL